MNELNIPMSTPRVGWAAIKQRFGVFPEPWLPFCILPPERVIHQNILGRGPDVELLDQLLGVL